MRECGAEQQIPPCRQMKSKLNLNFFNFLIFNFIVIEAPKPAMKLALRMEKAANSWAKTKGGQ